MCDIINKEERRVIMKFQNLSLHLKQIAATLAVGFVLVGVQ